MSHDTARICAILTVMLASLSRADTLNVPADYPTLAAAIDAVAPGDEIIVADGTYRGRGWTNLELTTPNVTIGTESGPDNCIIDCERSSMFLRIDESAHHSVVKGFTMLSGSGAFGAFLRIDGDSCEVRDSALLGANGGVSGLGGAIHASGASLVIDDCEFSDNYGGATGGGIVFFGSGITVSECTFTNNSARGGGAISVASGVATVTVCTFDGNSSALNEGGAIKVSQGGIVNITGSTFTANTSVFAGSAVGIGYDSTATITDSTISGGSAPIGGGVWAAPGSTLVMDNTRCEDNSSVTGGAVASEDSDASATGCEFSNNGSSDGGAWSATGGTSVFNGCDFYDNTATGNGGGCDFNGGTAELNDCNSNGNSAESGGFIHADGTDIELNGCSSDGDTATVTGGACSFIGGAAAAVDGCTFVACGAAFGGGCYNNGGSPVYTNSTFTGCYASVFGGAMTNEGAACVVLNCTFVDCSAEQGGGHIASSSGSSLTCFVSGFYEGIAATGGALYNLGFGSLRLSGEIVGCSFAGNEATQFGGAIYNYASSPLISLCSFGGNDATEGGAIYNIGSSPEVSNGVLWGNTPNEITDSGGSATTVLFSDVQGGWGGSGNTDVDPLFADMAAGDLRLLPGSPCVDAGDNTLVPADALDVNDDGDTSEALPWDLDELARFTDDPGTTDTGVSGNGYAEVVDMGAYELKPQPCDPDVNGDGEVNTLDFLVFLSLWAAQDLQADWNEDGVVNTLDFLAFLNDWVAGC